MVRVLALTANGKCEGCILGRLYQYMSVSGTSLKNSCKICVCVSVPGIAELCCCCVLWHFHSCIRVFLKFKFGVGLRIRDRLKKGKGLR